MEELNDVNLFNREISACAMRSHRDAHQKSKKKGRVQFRFGGLTRFCNVREMQARNMSQAEEGHCSATCSCAMCDQQNALWRIVRMPI
jgi:hypothetical protein